MIQLFLHLLGDYFLQNDYLAINKSKMSTLGYVTCWIHCLLYAIPFGLYYSSIPVFSLIFFSHFLVDKYGLAVYWTKLINWNWDSSYFLGMSNNRPQYLVVWLHIIRDNSIHIFCNYLIIQHYIH